MMASTFESSRDKNFAGLFPFWDVVFGTFYMPRGEAPRSFGTNTPVPKTVLGQLLFPFRRARAPTEVNT